MTVGAPDPTPLALSRSGLDRAALRRRDQGWLVAAWSDPGSRVLVLADGRAPVRGTDGGPRLVLVPPAQAPDGVRLLLGVDPAGLAHLAVLADRGDLPAGLPDGTDLQALTLREVGAALPALDVGMLVEAVGLEAWHATHRHCPRCGAATEVEAAGHVRRCPADGSEHFPRTDPAVIMLVTDGDRCVLGRQPGWPPGMWSALAGFVEPGESLEQAVAREVAEEIGVPIDPAGAGIRYVGSQPWPFPASLMLAFTAGTTTPGAGISLADDELEAARWFSRAELRAAISAGEVWLPPPVSIAHALITGWLDG